MGSAVRTGAAVLAAEKGRTCGGDQHAGAGLTNRTEADRRYSELFDLIRDKLPDDNLLLGELDEVVGQRLCEAQAWAVQRLFWTWQQAAVGMIDEALLPDGPRTLEDYRHVADLR